MEDALLPGGSLPDGKPLRLLKAVPGKVYDRLIVRYPFQTDSDYAFFYHESAKRLAGTFKGDPIDDTILLPFLMLYRHAYELKLKNLVKQFAMLRRRYISPSDADLDPAAISDVLKNKAGHNLAKLLNEFLKHYEALDLPEQFPSDVRRVILMIHDADRPGTAFRYAGTLPNSQDNADFPDLVAMLDDAFGDLGAIGDWVDAMYSALPDPEDEYF